MSGCPVKHDNPAATATAAGLGAGLGAGAAEVPSGCPVKHEDRVASKPKPMEYNPLTNDFKFDQTPLDSQKEPLKTVRAVSTIPRGDYIAPHQIQNVDKWVYPSEQQYFNAMKKKGYNPTEKEIPVILHIHNVVNEQGWDKIREWEALRGNVAPKLRRFTGRPNDLSPKAYMMNMLGYSRPFDRHDWIIDRNGEDVRYVIDFYTGRQTAANAGPSIYLDVRPALDSVTAVVDTIGFEFRKKFNITSLPIATLGTYKFYSKIFNSNYNLKNSASRWSSSGSSNSDAKDES